MAGRGGAVQAGVQLGLQRGCCLPVLDGDNQSRLNAANACWTGRQGRALNAATHAVARALLGPCKPDGLLDRPARF